MLVTTSSFVHLALDEITWLPNEYSQVYKEEEVKHIIQGANFLVAMATRFGPALAQQKDHNTFALGKSATWQPDLHTWCCVKKNKKNKKNKILIITGCYSQQGQGGYMALIIMLNLHRQAPAVLFLVRASVRAYSHCMFNAARAPTRHAF